MHSRLVILRRIVKAGMIDNILLPVVIHKGRIMSGRHVCHFQARQIVIAGQLQSIRRLPVILRIQRKFTVHIYIVSVDRLRAEHADLIAALPRKPSIGYKEVVIAALLIIHDIRSFDRRMVSAHQLFAKVRVYPASLIVLRMDDLSGLRIQFQQKDPARPGTVDHPHPSVFVIKHGRIDRIRVFFKFILIALLDIPVLRLFPVHVVCHIRGVQRLRRKSRVDHCPFPDKRPFNTLAGRIAEIRCVPGG